MSTKVASKKAPVKASTKSTSTKANAKPIKLSSKSSSKSGAASASTKARRTPTNPTVAAPQAPPDLRRPLADLIHEQQIAQRLENTTAFEVKNNTTGENFIIASPLSPRMGDLFNPGDVTITPKATARAGQN